MSENILTPDTLLHLLPAGQTCMRELERIESGHSRQSVENVALATTDYNGHGYWVCAQCNKMLNDEFDRDFD